MKAFAHPPKVRLSFFGNGRKDRLYTQSYVNVGAIVIDNGSTASLVVPAGTASQPGSLQLDFGSLMTASALGAVKPVSASWGITVSAGQLTLKPADTLTIPADRTVKVALTGIVTDLAAGSSLLTLTLNGTTSQGGIGSLASASHYVHVLPPPSPGTTSLDMAVGFETNTIPVGIQTSLRLFLVNNAGAPVTWTGSAPPTFQLGFVTGGGAQALTTTSGAAAITVVPAAQDSLGGDANGGASAWTVSAPTASRPAWTLTPQSKTRTLFGVGAAATAAFDIRGVTAPAVGITPANLSYTGMGGYADSAATLPIVKMPLPLPAIDSFTASAASLDLRNDEDSVTLSFQVQNARSVVIYGTDYFQAANGSGTVSGSVTVTAQETTTYTLVAQGAGGAMVQQTLTVTVSPNLYELMPANTIMLWAGADVPPGWVLCDAHGGTPDLVDRFVVGAGNTYSPGQNGDADSHVHQIASFGGTTNSGGKHLHSFGPISFHIAGSLKTSPVLQDGLHSHSVNDTGFNTGAATVTGTAPGVTADGVRPAWYSLAYIVKVY